MAIRDSQQSRWQGVSIVKSIFPPSIFIPILLLLAHTPGLGDELWVAPAIDPPDIEVGDWAVTETTQAHFSFAIPDDLLTFASAKVVLLGKNNKDTSYDLYLSITRDGAAHDAVTASDLDPAVISLVRYEFLEVDVTDFLAGVFSTLDPLESSRAGPSSRP